MWEKKSSTSESKHSSGEVSRARLTPTAHARCALGPDGQKPAVVCYPAAAVCVVEGYTSTCKALTTHGVARDITAAGVEADSSLVRCAWGTWPRTSRGAFTRRPGRRCTRRWPRTRRGHTCTLLILRRPALERLRRGPGEHGGQPGAVHDTPCVGPRRFEALIAEHLDGLYRSTLRLTHERTAAEDPVEDVMLKAWRSFHTFQGESPTSWRFPFKTKTGEGRRAELRS